MNIAVRTYDSIGDEAFVLSTWIKSYRNCGSVRAVPTPIYNIGQRGRIMKLLREQETYILVASDIETPELIYGYVVCKSPNTIHYLYVKNAYRNMGIGKALLQHLDWNEPIFYTHRSPEIFIERKLKDDENLKTLVYNPYLLENL
jgi:GNAT superfamily N-acetyltransferase